MIPKKFLIPSLVAAGLFKPGPLQAALTHAAATPVDDPNDAKLLQRFTQDHPMHFADHRSHSSHSSHSSHRSGSGGHYSHTSHRSSTGGYGPPVYSPPLPEPVYSGASDSNKPSYNSSSSGVDASSTIHPQSLADLPSSAGPDRASPPQAGASTTAQGRTERFKAVVQRVQIGLLGHGDYRGSIDGHVGPAMRKALRKFQTTHGLKVTGTITPQTLDALRIASG